MNHFTEKKNPDARRTALSILNKLERKRETLDMILEENPDLILLSRSDRALVNALIYGTLRWRARLDWIIAYFSNTRVKKIKPDILNILRLGLFQIIYLDRIPVSAAVNTSVEMAKTRGAPWIAGFVNGVLRNAARGYETVPFPDIDKAPVSSLAADKSFPEWLIRRWLKRLGREETVKLCDAINTIPGITLRVNTLKTNRDTLMKSLEPEVGRFELTDYSQQGIRIFNPKVSVPELKAFKAGWFQVQDEAAQRVTYLLNPKPGERVLDACAGLGGKTGHIADMMRNSGRIVAIDRDQTRLSRLRTEMERLGASVVETVTHDLNENRLKLCLGEQKFDRVLLDAPCSGLGVLRRNPDAKWAVSENALAAYGDRQVRFLERLARFVKPSGVLVYAVCSTEPEENEAVMDAFLRQHPEFYRAEFCPTHHGLAGIGGVEPHSMLKTFPHRDNMDGFFGVCFRRKE